MFIVAKLFVALGYGRDLAATLYWRSGFEMAPDTDSGNR
jgi:hypothetical protein